MVEAAAGCWPDVGGGISHEAWWRRGADATMRLAMDHGWRGSPYEDVEGAEWIGRDWDGQSDIDLGGLTLSKPFVASLIHELRLGIESLRLHICRLPDHHSVRICDLGDFQLGSLVIDIDFGEFILPLGLSGRLLVRSPDPGHTTLLAMMIDLLREVDAVRTEIASLEEEVRESIRHQAIGNCVLPLWFRFRPLGLETRPTTPFNHLRDIVTLTLDEVLRPVMNVYSENDAWRVFSSLHFGGEIQRRRTALRADLQATQSAGLITEVALGVVRTRGLDPLETLKSLQGQRQHWQSIVHRAGTLNETVTLYEGVLDATIVFEGGSYDSGALTLDGDYPRSVVTTAKGRPLSDFVDHPAFRDARVQVRRAIAVRDGLRLYHTVNSTRISAQDASPPGRDDSRPEP